MDRDSNESGILAEYVDLFLKYKQESSGFPDWVQSDQDKLKYIEQYYNHEGIQLDLDNIRRNEALRSLSKLCLNSMWGKFAERMDKRTKAYVRDQESFLNFLTDQSKDVTNFHILDENLALLEWCHVYGYVPDSENANIFLAAFIT